MPQPLWILTKIFAASLISLSDHDFVRIAEGLVFVFGLGFDSVRGREGVADSPLETEVGTSGGLAEVVLLAPSVLFSESSPESPLEESKLGIDTLRGLLVSAAGSGDESSVSVAAGVTDGETALTFLVFGDLVTSSLSRKRAGVFALRCSREKEEAPLEAALEFERVERTMRLVPPRSVPRARFCLEGLSASLKMTSKVGLSVVGPSGGEASS